MNSEWLTYISKHHAEWVAIVRSFGSKEPEDIVQDMYIKIHRYIDPAKIIQNNEVNKGYIWFTLRTLFLNECTKYKPEKLDNIIIQQVEESEIQKVTFDVIIEKINTTVSKLNWYDEKLFNLYFKTDLSQRDIARETKISLSSISNSIKQYKALVKTEVGEDYEDYKNGDYEWI